MFLFIVISWLKRNNPPLRRSYKYRDHTVTSHNLQTENLKRSQPHFLNKAMSAAVVSQRWEVNLHMNQLPDATLRELNQLLKTRVNQGKYNLKINT